MCYGKCFLDKGLGLADQAPNPDNLIAQLKFEIHEFLIDDYVIPASPATIILAFLFPQTSSITDGVTYSIFHPPLV